MDENTTRARLLEIRSYIKSNYPDSCIARNDFVPGIASDSDLIMDCSDFVLYELLHFCRCGCPKNTMVAICDYLDIVEFGHMAKVDRNGKVIRASYHSNLIDAQKQMQEKFKVAHVTDNPILQYMAYVVDDLGLTEHGTNINDAWITDLGKMCKFVLRLRIENDNDNPAEEASPDDTEKTKAAVQKATSALNKYLLCGALTGSGSELRDIVDTAKYLIKYIDETKGHMSKAILLPLSTMDFDGDPEYKVPKSLILLWSTLCSLYGEPMEELSSGYILDPEGAIKFLEFIIRGMDNHDEGQKGES